MAGNDGRSLRARQRDSIWTPAAATAVVAVALFSLVPEIDIVVAQAIRVEPDSITDFAVGKVRHSIMLAFALFLLAAIAACVSRWPGRSQSLLSKRGWAFVLLCLLIGPGLVSNALLKDQWGRARPRDTTVLGGEARFTAALVPAAECRRNCSFVSGEASSTYMVFFALGMALPHARIALFAIGALAGGAVGLLRMMQGAHFLSDVVFAGLIMAFVAWALHRAVIGLAQPVSPQTHPVAGFS